MVGDRDLLTLIMSDSHGNEPRLKQIASRVAADHVIHCGDFCTKKFSLPLSFSTVVKGNCDLADVPQEEILQKEGYRFLITHGHQYQVKTSLLSLKYRALEVGANIVCFGHSHFPLCQKVGDVLYINPGSITKPRGFSYPTYACLETQEGTVKVTYYHIDGKKTSERGGTYSLPLILGCV